MQKCKADGGEENTEHCGRTIYTALEGREWERVYVLSAVMLRSLTTYNYLYSSDSGHALLFAIKIIIALQIGQESVKGKNKLDQLTQKTSTDKKRLRGKISRRTKMTFAESFGIVQTHLTPGSRLKITYLGMCHPKGVVILRFLLSQFSHY